MKRIDLNVDIGEAFPYDLDLIAIATSANVCCGAHAGSIETTVVTKAGCRERGLRVGAHPGYPDRASMGRAPSRSECWEAYRKSIFDQMESFGLCDYVKPHGAFYNEAALEGPAAQCLAELLSRCGKPMMGLAGTAHEAAAAAAGVALLREGFADRAYTPQGLLVPRTEPGAVLSDLDAIAAQAVLIAGRVDSICLHGDSEGCVLAARRVREALEAAGFQVAQ